MGAAVSEYLAYFNTLVREGEASSLSQLEILAIEGFAQWLDSQIACNCHCADPGMWHDQGCPMRRLPELTMWREVE